MIDVERNPTGFRDTYLESLNASFSGWGDRAMYAWAFERAVSGPMPDLLVLRENGVLLAGSAVTYRVLRTAQGRTGLVGIMTGSWTLPAARGRGCFSRIIDESVDLVRSHRGALLLAYVTDTNASYRRLEAAGAALFPTRYLFTTEQTPSVEDGAPVSVIEHAGDQAASWFARFEQQRGPGATVAYGSAEDWRSQFIDRPGHSYVIEADGLGFCIVEEHDDFDRLQGISPSTPADLVRLIRAALARAQRRSRKVFLFSAEPAIASTCAAQLGLGAAPGFLTMLPADLQAAAALVGGPISPREVLRDAPAFCSWALHSGDRM